MHILNIDTANKAKTDPTVLPENTKHDLTVTIKLRGDQSDVHLSTDHAAFVGEIIPLIQEYHANFLKSQLEARQQSDIDNKQIGMEIPDMVTMKAKRRPAGV